MNLETKEVKRFYHKKSDKNSLDCNQVRALYLDQEGILWAGTGFPFFEKKEGGLNKYISETESFVRYLHERNNPESLAGHHVRAIFEDSERRFWVGSSGGLQLFDRKTEKFTASPMTLTLDGVKKEYPHFSFFFEDNRRRFWAGHFNTGIFCVDPSANEQVVFNANKKTPKERRLRENAAWTIFQSKDGVIWISTAADKSNVYRIVEPQPLINNIEPLPIEGHPVDPPPPRGIIDRLKDSAQYLAAENATSQQIPLDNQQATTPIVKKMDGRTEIESNTGDLLWIVEDNQSDMVLMNNTQNGESVQFKVEQPSKVHADWKSKPKADENGNFWVCLENGLLKLDMHEKKGFFIDAKKLGGRPPFKGMVMDNLGVFWILGQTLLKFEPLLERTFCFDQDAAVGNLPEMANGIFVNENGNIVLQADNGFHSFNPIEWRDSTNAPVLRITDFELLDLADKAAFDSSQQSSFWETNWLELKHFQNAFFFRFAVMDFQSPEFHQLEYMLENHDKNWRVSEGDPRAIYANVPPGTYRFKVRGANQFGIWGDEAVLNVVIKAPWWRTWGAYLAYALLVLLLIFWIYRFQLNRRLAENEAVRLKELHTTKSRLYTNITHEFRTPLTIIMGMAKELAVGSQQSAVTPEEREKLSKGFSLIQRNGEQLLGLVNQLLDLSKLEGGKMEFKPIQGDIVAFLKNQIEGLKPYAAEQGLGLHFIPDMERLDMDYDPEKLQQAVANILSNAIKFTPKGGHVHVNVDANDRDPVTTHLRLTLKIRDTGRGIPAEALPHIFDRFYQVDDSSTRQGEGSGIGLSLTKEITELMGGEIRVKSWEGTGTEFTILLPIKKRGLLQLKDAAKTPKKELAAAPAVLQIAEAKTVEPFQPLNPIAENNSLPNLLLIEDNPDVVAYLATCLQDQYTLLVGEDGQEGIEIAFERIPDIIITDVMMPHKDGFEVSQILKNDQRTSHIPIIMLTAKADMNSKLEGLEKGADAYLSKPFNKEELLIRLKKLLELRKRLQQHYQSVAGLVSAPVAIVEGDMAKAEKQSTEQEDYFVMKVSRSVESHLDDFEFNVEKLCRDVGMSHSQLHRKLTALTGLSATHFIRNIRLSKAKELLQQQPPMSITAVAMDCGFNDPGYFGRVFKKEFGMTPMEWQMH